MLINDMSIISFRMSLSLSIFISPTYEIEIDILDSQKVRLSVPTNIGPRTKRETTLWMKVKVDRGPGDWKVVRQSCPRCVNARRNTYNNLQRVKVFRLDLFEIMRDGIFFLNPQSSHPYPATGRFKPPEFLNYDDLVLENQK